MKVTDPDGGIHCIEKKKKNNSKVVAMNVMTRLSSGPKEGWTLSLKKTLEFQHCFIFPYLSGGRNSGEKS